MEGDLYKDAVTLIKDKSPAFAALMEKQEFKTSSQVREATMYEEEVEREDTELANEHRRGHKKDKDDEKKDAGKKKHEKKKKLEPSLRWKNLGITDDAEHEKE